MTYKYKIQIFTKEIRTNFIAESLKPADSLNDIHKLIIDYLGKKDIKWEPNPLQFNGTATGSEFYITYEEVTDGPEQNGIVRKEDSPRVSME